MISALCVGLVALAGCASASSDVAVKAATPASTARTRTTEQQSPPTRPRPTTTENHTPGTAPTPPDTEAPLPSIERQADAQALIDEVPKLVGDSDLLRKTPQVDGVLKTALQAIADGKAGGDSSFFTAVEQAATDGQVVNPYLICPLADGDGCSAAKEDFEQYMKACTGDTTQWTAMLVPGADGWAAAGVCLWKPSDAEKAAALDTVSKAITAASNAGTPLTRDPAVDAAAQAWAAAPASTEDPTKLPAFKDFTNVATDATGIQSPGQITNGNLTSFASQTPITSFSNGITRFGLATVVDSGGLEILIVAVD